MANAGNHNDTRLLKQMITEGKLIKISPTDHPVIQKIKSRFNFIVTHDETYYSKYNGKKYIYHKAWNQVGRALIWVNQLRVKHWFFDNINR